MNPSVCWSPSASTSASLLSNSAFSCGVGEKNKWGPPKLGVPYWGPCCKRILPIGVNIRGPLFSKTPSSNSEYRTTVCSSSLIPLAKCWDPKPETIINLPLILRGPPPPTTHPPTPAPAPLLSPGSQGRGGGTRSAQLGLWGL